MRCTRTYAGTFGTARLEYALALTRLSRGQSGEVLNPASECDGDTDCEDGSDEHDQCGYVLMCADVN